MLTVLRVKEFGAFDAVTVEFGSGLNVFTGDAATARSLAVGAFGAAVGGVVPPDAVRPRTTAVLEARFTLSGDSAAGQWLRAQGIEGRELVLSREISADGRSRARINGGEVAVEVMRELGDLLVEITGLGNGRLLRPAAQLDLLDAFGGPALETLRADIGERLRALTALRAEQDTLKEAERDRFKQIETLTQQIREIDAAAPERGEEEALAARRTRLLNAEKLAAAARAGYAALTESEGQSAADPFARAKTALRDVASVDPVLGRVSERLDALAGGLAEVADELGRYVAGVEARPGELAAIDHRMELLRGLRKKYGESMEAILTFRAEAAAMLAQLQRSDARGPQIASQLLASERELADRCERLTVLRKEAAVRLAADVDHQLGALEMGRMRLTVNFARDADADGLALGDRRVAVGPTGVDRVAFLVGPASDDDPKPIEQGAGTGAGDLSRLMLVIRHVLAGPGGLPVIVSGDVDEGMGARTARALGQLLDAIARTRQAVCVTHLPQIASMGNRHLVVEKETTGGRSRMQVRVLDPKDRVQEIARMLSGRMPAAIAREYAAELLGRARRTTGVAAPREAGGGTS